MSHILVTGANGFIGSHLVDELVKSGQHHITVFDLCPRVYDALPSGVTFIQGNLNDANLIRRMIIDQNIEIVYHAAWASIHETSLKNPAADIEANLVPTLHLLEACREADVKRMIFISSGGTVYGLPRSSFVREDHFMNPINAYGVAKMAVEKYLYMYHYLYGLEYVIFRPSVPYGPRQDPHRRQGAVAVFIYRALRGEPITIWGDGETLRDYFYIEDMISPLVAAMELPVMPDPIFNLAGMQGYTLNQLVQTIEDTLAVKVQVGYKAAREFDVPRLRLDTSAATEKLNWSPVTTLPEGIQRTALWMQEIYF